MSQKSSLLVFTFIAALALISSPIHANIWIDEDFEGTEIFEPGVTVDTFRDSGPVNVDTTTLITDEGTQDSSKAFDGANSYRLDPGDTFAVADGYDDQSTGNFIYFQFAVNVDPIPPTGDVARFEYNTNLDTVDHRFVIELVSDGSVVTVTGAEELAEATAPATITTLASSSDWTFITLQINNDSNSPLEDPDPRFGTETFPPGAYFYADSTTESFNVPIDGAGTKDGNDWSITVDP